MVNRNFGKIENGIIKYSPYPIKTENEHIFTGDSKIYLEHGWIPVRYTNPPEKEGFYPVSSWEESETEIIQTWELIAIEEDDII